MSERMVKTATHHLVGNIRKPANHSPLEEVAAEEDVLGSEEKRKTLIEMSTTAASVRIVLPGRKTFISVEEMLFWT